MPDHMHDPIVTVRREDLDAILAVFGNSAASRRLSEPFYRLVEASQGAQCWEPAVVPADDAHRLVALAQKRLTLDADDEMALGRIADCLPAARADDDRPHRQNGGSHDA